MSPLIGQERKLIVRYETAITKATKVVCTLPVAKANQISIDIATVGKVNPVNQHWDLLGANDIYLDLLAYYPRFRGTHGR